MISIHNKKFYHLHKVHAQHNLQYPFGKVLLL